MINVRFEDKPLCQKRGAFFREKGHKMTQSGLYKLSQKYVQLVKDLGGTYRDNKERPIYCCIKDRFCPDIYWAIPTSSISNRTSSQLDRIAHLCDLPDRDIRSCYYHIGHTNRPAIFKISNALPITESFIDSEYTSHGKHLILRDKKQIEIIERKLSRILFDESRYPNKYEQHISSIYAFLKNGQHNMKFEKSCGAVLFKQRGKRYYVLVKSTNNSFWGLPKGRVEANETEQETALREIMEETGVQAKIIGDFRRQIEYDMPCGARKQVVFFAAEYGADAGAFGSNPSEISNIVAVPLEEALKMLTHDDMRQVLLQADEWISQQRS